MFGPGTIVTLGVAAIIVVFGYMESRETSRANFVPPVPRPLSKPEPSTLLRRTDLHLDAKQRSQIERIDSEWESDKAGLERSMATFEPSGERLDALSQGLAGYSDLSRAYDADRSRTWNLALQVLTAHQRVLVDGGSK